MMQILRNPLPNFPCAMKKPLKVAYNPQGIVGEAYIIELLIITGAGWHVYISLSQHNNKYIVHRHYYNKERSYRVLSVLDTYEEADKWLTRKMETYKTYNVLFDRIKL